MKVDYSKTILGTIIAVLGHNKYKVKIFDKLLQKELIIDAYVSGTLMHKRRKIWIGKTVKVLYDQTSYLV